PCTVTAGGCGAGRTARRPRPGHVRHRRRQPRRPRRSSQAAALALRGGPQRMLPSAARGEAGLDEAADLVAPPADISENTEQAELPGFVRTAMDGLNPGEREVIELGLRHDLSGADLAAVLGVSRNQAHALASRARGRLERELGVLLVARSGRWACPTLDLMLHDW